jgi:hypothetical protein
VLTRSSYATFLPGARRRANGMQFAASVQIRARIAESATMLNQKFAFFVD